MKDPQKLTPLIGLALLTVTAATAAGIYFGIPTFSSDSAGPAPVTETVQMAALQSGTAGGHHENCPTCVAAKEAESAGHEAHGASCAMTAGGGNGGCCSDPKTPGPTSMLLPAGHPPVPGYRTTSTGTKVSHGNAPGHEVIANPDSVQLAAATPYPLENCPVSGAQLGSMGDPTVLLIGDQEIKLCCGGCLDKVKADPRRILASLGQDVIE